MPRPNPAYRSSGILAFIFARIFAEPQIQAAIDYESGRDAAQAVLDKAAGLTPEAAGPDLFSRTIQANVGIGVGMIAFGAAMGGLYAVAYILACGRTGNLRPRNLALLVALVRSPGAGTIACSGRVECCRLATCPISGGGDLRLLLHVWFWMLLVHPRLVWRVSLEGTRCESGTAPQR
jgi:hypothetical protein